MWQESVGGDFSWIQNQQSIVSEKIREDWVPTVAYPNQIGNAFSPDFLRKHHLDAPSQLLLWGNNMVIQVRDITQAYIYICYTYHMYFYSLLLLDHKKCDIV